MNILLTGGAGFIGSHLSEYLLERGHRVCIVDDLSTGSAENVLPLKANPGFSYHFQSAKNRHLMAELVDCADFIFHLAAAVGVRLIVESPVRTIETNVQLTELVLELAAKKKKTVLVASTSEVYGKRVTVPFREDDDLIIGPTRMGRWSYACSKALDEFLAIAYWREQKLPVIVVRLFNTVGPRQTGRYGMVIPNFVRQALQGENITVFGDGAQQRCFLHVADVVRALESLAMLPAAIGQVFNIGSTEEISILHLAQRVRELTASPSAIVNVPYAQAYEEGFEDMMRRVPDTSKLQSAIGFQPRFQLDQILRDVIAFESRRLDLTVVAHAR